MNLQEIDDKDGPVSEPDIEEEDDNDVEYNDNDDDSPGITDPENPLSQE